MNNAELHVQGEMENLEAAVELAMAMFFPKGAVGWSIDRPTSTLRIHAIVTPADVSKGLASEFPIPLEAKMVAALAMGWIHSVPKPERDGGGDIDGHMGLGFRIEAADWFQDTPGDFARLQVRAIWAEYHK